MTNKSKVEAILDGFWQGCRDGLITDSAKEATQAILTLIEASNKEARISELKKMYRGLYSDGGVADEEVMLSHIQYRLGQLKSTGGEG